MRIQDAMKQFKGNEKNRETNAWIVRRLTSDDIVTFQNVRDEVAFYYREYSNEWNLMVRWVECQVTITLLNVE